MCSMKSLFTRRVTVILSISSSDNSLMFLVQTRFVHELIRSVYDSTDELSTSLKFQGTSSSQGIPVNTSCPVRVRPRLGSLLQTTDELIFPESTRTVTRRDDLQVCISVVSGWEGSPPGREFLFLEEVSVYYEWIKREINKRLIFECRCDTRLKGKGEGSTHLTYTR